MIIRKRALALCALVVAVSCSDSSTLVGPVDPAGPRPIPHDVRQALDCTVEIATRAMSCTTPQPGAGSASASGQIIVGGQNVFVTLAAMAFSTAWTTRSSST
jgi:hypothetical protein